MERSTGGGTNKVVRPRRSRWAAIKGAIMLAVSMTISGCTTVSSIQSGVPRNAAPANPVPAFSVLGTISAVIMIVLALLAAYALVLVIVFLRLRIAELKRFAPPRNKPLH